MKIAEALLMQVELKKRLASLGDRIARCVRLQEGDTAPEQPEDLIRQCLAISEERMRLDTVIELANQRATLADGRTLAQALAEREHLKRTGSVYSTAIEASKVDPNRYGQAEIRWICTIDLKSMHQRVDDVARQVRELNVLIQAANWHHDL